MGFASTSVSVGTSSTAIAAANTNRRKLTITNDSSSTIYLAVGETAVLNSGYRLNANGGVYEVYGSESQQVVNGITSAAAQNATVVQEIF